MTTNKKESSGDRPSRTYAAVTLAPEMFAPFMSTGVVGSAFAANLASLELVNPRGFAADSRRTVDDAPYGGGPGMVLLPGPVSAAIDRSRELVPGAPVCNMEPGGRRLDDALARELAGLSGIIFLCGRYLGIDQRVIDSRVDFGLSVGDYVVSGGELPAMVALDAIMRHVPGVLGCRDSAGNDSFAGGGLAPPCYTRPPEFEGMRVPDVLMGGDHDKVRKWRDDRARARTLLWRDGDAGLEKWREGAGSDRIGRDEPDPGI